MADYPKLSENVLLVAWGRGDIKARDELIARYDSIAKTLAKRYQHNGAEPEDVLQEARLGVVEAVSLWDPKRGVKLSTFIWTSAEGKIRNLIRKEQNHREHEKPAGLIRGNGEITAQEARWRVKYAPKRKNPISKERE